MRNKVVDRWMIVAENWLMRSFRVTQAGVGALRVNRGSLEDDNSTTTEELNDYESRPKRIADYRIDTTNTQLLDSFQRRSNRLQDGGIVLGPVVTAFYGGP